MSAVKRKSAAPAVRLELGAGFALLCALVYFFGDGESLAALLAAIGIHELGHLLLMLFFGLRPVRLRSAASGLAIDYAGTLSTLQELLTTLAGPALGLLFAVSCAALGRLWGNEFLLLCAGLSLVLSAFNLLPAEPLDGGRALGLVLRAALGAERARYVLRAAGFSVCALLAAAGLFAVSRGLSPAPLLAALWLFILQRKKA